MKTEFTLTNEVQDFLNSKIKKTELTLISDVQDFLIDFNVPEFLTESYINSHKLNLTLIHSIIDKLVDDNKNSLNSEELTLLHGIAQNFVNDYISSQNSVDIHKNYDEILKNIIIEIIKNSEGY